MHIDNVIFLILSKNAYTKFSAGPIDCGFTIVDGFFSLLPEVEWNVNTSAFEYAGDILDMICYLLPIGTITSIITLIIGVAFIRIAISFIRTILGLIPFI